MKHPPKAPLSLMEALGCVPTADIEDKPDANVLLHRAELKLKIAKRELRIKLLETEVMELRREYRRSRPKGDE